MLTVKRRRSEVIVEVPSSLLISEASTARCVSVWTYSCGTVVTRSC
jgi:hypothetical protein